MRKFSFSEGFFRPPARPSDFFDDRQRIILGISVGIVGGLSSLLQALQSAFKFHTKSEMFRNSAEQYEKLIVEIKFELLRHNDKDFIDKLEKKILEIQNNCRYFPPRHIVDKHKPNNKFETINIQVEV